MTEAAKDFPFCGEQMLNFLHKERGIKGVSRKLRFQTSDSENPDPETSDPLQCFCGHAMVKGNSQKEARYFNISSACSGLSLSHRSNSENLTRFKIAADILIRFAGEFFTQEIKDTESL